MIVSYDTYVADKIKMYVIWCICEIKHSKRYMYMYYTDRTGALHVNDMIHGNMNCSWRYIVST